MTAPTGVSAGPGRPGPGSRLALWSLGALAVGVLLGLLGQTTGSPALARAAAVVEPAGTLWLRALEMTVIPLVVSQLLAALVRPGDGGAVGRLGLHAFLLFVAFLVAGGALAVLTTPVLLALLPPGRSLASVASAAAPDVAAGAGSGAATPGIGAWIVDLIPANPFQAAASGQLLPLLVAVVLFGMAASRLPEEPRGLLASVVRAVADAMMVMVGWVLRLTPVGVLALVWSLTQEAGEGFLGVIGSYIVLLCGLLVGVTLLVYPLAALAGATRVKVFARAVAPAQLVAASTQSSLASLPALLDGAEGTLGLPTSSAGFVLPLSVATFKPNQSVYHGFNLIFLAHVFDVSLTPAAVATFMAFTILMSFGVAGVPRGGAGFRMLPFYLAVGIPIEGVVLYEAVKTIPDVFMTVYNVTADLGVAAILSPSRRP